MDLEIWATKMTKATKFATGVYNIECHKMDRNGKMEHKQIIT